MAKKIDLNGLEFFKGKENSMVADEYSSSNTYALGDYAYYAGTLYRCTTAITTAEAWTSGHWTAAKLADDVSDLKSSTSKIVGDYKQLDLYPTAQGMINSSGKWANVNNNYLHVAIPVKSGDAIHIQGNGTSATFIAFLRSYSAPVTAGNAPDFSTSTGFTGRIQISASTNVDYTVPSDANYLFFIVYSGGAYTAGAFTINGQDIYKALGTSVVSLINGLKTTDGNVTVLQTATQALDFKSLSSYPETYGSIKDDGKWGNINSSYTHYAVSINPNDLVLVCGDDDVNSTIAVLKTYTTPVNGASVDFSTATGFTARIIIERGRYIGFLAPSDAHYLYVQKNGSALPTYLGINYVDITKGLTENITNIGEPKIVKWCAMGDSITKGYYSFIESDVADNAIDTQRKTWLYRVADYNRWIDFNIAIGGTGYLDGDGNEENQGYVLARETDFAPYNLVTLAYGINDWKDNEVLGTVSDDPTLETQTTVLGAMKATIEAIMTSNPVCKIIVILPLNSSLYGSESTNWSLGYEFSNSGTLEEFVQGMIDVCDYYGIQYIDMTHYSCINRKNIQALLPDGVHPSLDCHALLGAELSKKIAF